MERLGDEVREQATRLGGVTGMADIVSAWPRAVGEAIARNAWPARLARDGTLHVATSSSAWACELTLLEADVLRRLAGAVGDATPTRLRFAPGPLPEAERSDVPDRPPPPAPADVARGAAIAAAIEDESLRALVAKAAALSLAAAPSDRAL